MAETARHRSPIRVVVPEAGVDASVAPTGAAGKWTAGLRRGLELELGIAPEAVTLVRQTSSTSGSARNLWPARVARIRGPVAFGVQYVDLQVGQRRLAAAVTGAAIADLGLRRRSRVNVQVKATALRLRLRPKA